jgi:hypothetical protein
MESYTASFIDLEDIAILHKNRHFFTCFPYLLNNQGLDLSGAPVKKFARQKCRVAHLTGLVYPQ